MSTQQVRNPETGKMIKIEGPTYKKLLMQGYELVNGEFSHKSDIESVYFPSVPIELPGTVLPENEVEREKMLHRLFNEEWNKHALEENAEYDRQGKRMIAKFSKAELDSYIVKYEKREKHFNPIHANDTFECFVGKVSNKATVINPYTNRLISIGGDRYYRLTEHGYRMENGKLVKKPDRLLTDSERSMRFYYNGDRRDL